MNKDQHIYTLKEALRNCAMWACGMYMWNKSEILWVIHSALYAVDPEYTDQLWEEELKKEDTQFIQELWRMMRDLQFRVEEIEKILKEVKDE